MYFKNVRTTYNVQHNRFVFVDLALDHTQAVRCAEGGTCVKGRNSYVNDSRSWMPAGYPQILYQKDN